MYDSLGRLRTVRVRARREVRRATPRRHSRKRRRGVGQRRRSSKMASATPSGSSSSAASLAALMNRRTLEPSFLPGRLSTPVATSTPHGCTRCTASATFSGVRPPARMHPTVERQPLGQHPVEDLTRAAAGGRVDEDGVGRGVLGHPVEHAVTGRERLDQELHPLADPLALGRGLVAVELHRVEPGGVDHLDHPLGRLVAEDADGHDLGRQPPGDVTGLGDGDLAGRSGGEVEADRVGAHGHREERVLLVGHPADLDEHACNGTGRARSGRVFRSAVRRR